MRALARFFILSLLLFAFPASAQEFPKLTGRVVHTILRGGFTVRDGEATR